LIRYWWWNVSWSEARVTNISVIDWYIMISVTMLFIFKMNVDFVASKCSVAIMYWRIVRIDWSCSASRWSLMIDLEFTASIWMQLWSRLKEWTVVKARVWSKTCVADEMLLSYKCIWFLYHWIDNFDYENVVFTICSL
jgi:hypothetical protein